MKGICTYPPKKQQTVCEFISGIQETNTVRATDYVLLFRGLPCQLVKIPFPLFASYLTPPVPVPPPVDPIETVGVEFTNFLPEAPLLGLTDSIYLGNGGDPVSSAPNQVSAPFTWVPNTKYYITFAWDPSLGKISTSVTDIAPVSSNVIEQTPLEDSLWKDLGKIEIPPVENEETPGNPDNVEKHKLTSSTFLFMDTNPVCLTSNYISLTVDNQAADPLATLTFDEITYTSSTGVTYNLSSISPAAGTAVTEDYQLPVSPCSGFDVTASIIYTGLSVSATQAITNSRVQVLMKTKA